MIVNQGSTNQEPPLRGYLLIYVDGYKYNYKNVIHFFQDDGKLVAAPDALLAPPKYDIGSMEWWEEGWAVGDNDRGRLCKRFYSFKCRKFRDYDEAVAYAYRRQQKFKKQQHILVYATNGVGGREQLHVVRSMDEIDAIEAKVAAEIEANNQAIAEQKDRWDAEYPKLKLLQNKFGRSMGMTLSALLKELSEKGEEAIRVSRPKSTLARQLKMLRDLGLMR